MLGRLRFPLLYVLEAALGATLLGSFASVIVFLAADPISSSKFAGKTLPPTWRAAFVNHGRYVRGFLVSDHPFFFALAVLTLLGSLYFLWRVHRTQNRDVYRQQASTNFKIAQAAVLVFWAVMGLTLVFSIFKGIRA